MNNRVVNNRVVGNRAVDSRDKWAAKFPSPYSAALDTRNPDTPNLDTPNLDEPSPGKVPAFPAVHCLNATGKKRLPAAAIGCGS